MQLVWTLLFYLVFLKLTPGVLDVICECEWYSVGLLNDKLNQINWQTEFDDVQSCWNHLENNLLKVIDEIAPTKKFCLNTAIDVPNKIAKNAINKRNRLLKQFKKDQPLS